MVKMFIIFVFFLLLPSNVSAFSLSADEMYRDLLIYEDDAPPDVIVNRKSPDINGLTKKSSDNSDNKDEIIEISEPENTKQQTKDKNLEDAYQNIIDEKISREKQAWQEIIKKVQKNQATAFDIAEIKRKSDANDKDALELLAWMYTTGSGVPQNLVAAYDLYMKASNLGIKDADKNAILIYKNMNEKEKEAISKF